MTTKTLSLWSPSVIIFNSGYDLQSLLFCIIVCACALE